MSTGALRPARAVDLPALRRLFATVFPTPAGGWRPEQLDRSARRFERALAHDAGGAWVAVGPDGGVDGAAVAVVREGIWVLSFLGVHPAAQARGLGGSLLEAALGYGAGCHGFLLNSSSDPRALGLYARAGFALHPTLYATGPVRRERLGAAEGVHAGGAGDLPHCSAVDRAVRGGSRLGDLAFLLELGARLYLSPRGYAIADGGTLHVLAAEDDREAAALLRQVLADAPPDREAEVSWITARQQWALRVVVDAGLRLAPSGPLAVRGRLGPLAPWLPNGALL